MAVWKVAITMANPKNIAIFGSSAGGGLTLAMVLRAKQEGLPLPAAIACGTPFSDSTKTGDTYFSNQKLDNILVSSGGVLEAGARTTRWPRPHRRRGKLFVCWSIKNNDEPISTQVNPRLCNPTHKNGTDQTWTESLAHPRHDRGGRATMLYSDAQDTRPHFQHDAVVRHHSREFRLAVPSRHIFYFHP